MTPAFVPTPDTQTTERPRSFLSRSMAWLFSQRHFHIKLLSGTAAGVVVIIFLAGIFLLVTYRNHSQEALRTHTVEVMRLSSVIENDIAALEASQRGYLLTGQAAYAEAFTQRRSAIKERIEELTTLILESPAQRKRLMKVQEIVQRWLNEVAGPQFATRPVGGPHPPPR